MTNANAGIIYQHVDAAHGANGLMEPGLDFLKFGNICAQNPRKFRHFPLDMFRSLRIPIQHAHNGSFFEETCGGGCADSASAAGDKNALSFESSHSVLVTLE
jgi:hypothetical protein